MRYLFWNTNKYSEDKKLVIKEIIQYYSCDIIALVEYNSNLEDLLYDLNLKSEKQYYIFKDSGFTENDRIKIITTHKITKWYDYGYYKILYLSHESIDDQLLTIVHFPSKCNDSYGAQAIAIEVKRMIEEIENELKTSNTIIMGDFNMNPFEIGMVASYALHAISSKNDAKDEDRSIYYRDNKMFYNPMWSFLGEQSKSHGTYYYRASGTVCYFWNAFDQVIVRPSIIEYLNEDTIEIIRSINGFQLCKSNGRPNSDVFSDHLPLYFEII